MNVLKSTPAPVPSVHLSRLGLPVSQDPQKSTCASVGQHWDSLGLLHQRAQSKQPWNTRHAFASQEFSHHALMLYLWVWRGVKQTRTEIKES